MQRFQILVLILAAAIVAGISLALVVSHGRLPFDLPGPAAQGSTESQQAQADSDTIDEAPISSDLEEQMRREAKNRRYNRGGRDLTTMIWSMSIWEESCGPVMPLLPTGSTPIIVLATVTSTQPYLSEDRSYVYTEYALQVEEFLKKDAGMLPMAGDRLILDRTGGVLRLKNGHVIRYYSGGSNMARPLHVGERCVLFLNWIHEGLDLMLGPGFLLRNGQAYLLGGQEGQETLVGPLSGMANELSQEVEFLKAVRRAIKNRPSPRFYSGLDRSR